MFKIWKDNIMVDASETYLTLINSWGGGEVGVGVILFSPVDFPLITKKQ